MIATARHVLRLAAALACALAATACSGKSSPALISGEAPICADTEYAYADIEGVRLHYRLEGPETSDLAPVVVIHGAYANLCDPALAFLPRMAEERAVMFVDRPGLGRSDRPGDGHDPRVQARLIRGLAAEAGLEDPIVLGHSFGGAVAIAYGLDTVDRPEAAGAASGLLLLAPVSHPWPGGVNWWNSVSETPLLGFIFRRAIVPLVGPAMVKGAVKSAYLPDDYVEKTGPDQVLRPDRFRANARDLVKLKSIVREMSARYSGLDLPIEIVAGDADTTVYTRIHSRALAAEASDARLEVLEGVGHQLYYERPEAVYDALARLDGRFG